MKLVSYKFKDQPMELRMGCIVNNHIVDIRDAYLSCLQSDNKMTLARLSDTPPPSNPTMFFSIGLPAIEKAQHAYHYAVNHSISDLYLKREDIYLSTPVPEPTKIICVGRNYINHVTEMKGELPEIPVLFAKFNNALIGPEDGIEKSEFTQKLDYEVELAVVIGKEASGVNKKDALSYVAGYTIGNDISARDLQKRTPQWLQGKTLDRSTPLGPWVVTTDEIGDPSNLTIRSSVNGEERQSSNTRHLIFDIPFLIEFISSLMTLRPGDIILTGTPEGVGFALDPPRFLQAGDVVKLEIEKIGQMENRVLDK